MIAQNCYTGMCALRGEGGARVGAPYEGSFSKFQKPFFSLWGPFQHVRTFFLLMRDLFGACPPYKNFCGIPCTQRTITFCSFKYYFKIYNKCLYCQPTVKINYSSHILRSIAVDDIVQHEGKLLKAVYIVLVLLIIV